MPNLYLYILLYPNQAYKTVIIIIIFCIQLFYLTDKGMEVISFPNLQCLGKKTYVSTQAFYITEQLNW